MNCMELYGIVKVKKKNHHIKSFPVDWFPFHAPDWTHPFQPRGTDHGVAHATATFRNVKGRQPISLDISKTGKKNGSTRSDQSDLQQQKVEKKKALLPFFPSFAKNKVPFFAVRSAPADTWMNLDVSTKKLVGQYHV